MLLPPEPAVLHDWRGLPQVAWAHRDQAAWVAAAATAALGRLGETSGLGDAAIATAGPLPQLALYDNFRQLATAWSQPTDNPATAVYWGGKVGIVVPAAWLPIAGGEAGGEEEGAPGGGASAALEALVTHELTHWAYDCWAGGGIPRWLGEGLAMRAEERSAGQDAPGALIAGRAVRAGIAPIAEFDRWLGRRGVSAAHEWRAYALSRSVVAFLDESAGVGWERTLVFGLGAGEQFGQALSTAVGPDLANSLEARWREWLGTK
jgi:hypothetical protein